MKRAGFRRVALAACLIVVSGVAACDSTPNAATATARVTDPPTATAGTAGPPTASPLPTPIPGLSSVTPAAIPSEPPGVYSREAINPDPAFEFGYVVQITTSGFHPNWLVAPCCHPITFINLINRANAVSGPELTSSPLIPPGASWTWTPPNAESVAYASLTFPTMTGVIQVNQTTE